MKKISVCFGGYCPMHQGHLDVIMRAKKETDCCFVVVCGYESEPRGLELNKNIKQRTQLVKQFFKDDETIHVISVNDTELGLDESMSLNNWKIWTNCVCEQIYDYLHPYNEYDENNGLICHILKRQELFTNNVELVFYVGETRYVKDLESIGYKSVLVGYDENAENHRVNNISASMVRSNPLKYWDKIVPTFKPGLTKKILVLGTASEGKTTLVKDIANYFQIPHTTEFGRDYMEVRNMLDPDLSPEDFLNFLIGQRQYYFDALNNPGNPGIIISDTDNLVTLMYARAYVFNDEMNMTENDFKMLYSVAKALQSGVTWDKIFLITPHNKFVDDGSRYMGQASIEERMKNYRILKNYLTEFGLIDKVVELNGSYMDHFNAVKDYINGLYNV